MATQVFLLTDIEGSTRRWAEQPEEMRRALERHDELVRAAMETAGGEVFKHTGDGLFVVFASPAAALAASVGSQRALAGAPWGGIGTLKVRMAIHAGEAERRGNDWYGPALNRTARLAGLAHGNQILASDAVRALLADVPLDEVKLVDLGRHRLRDLPGGEHVWQVVAPGLPVDFPALRSASERVGNLPEQLTSFLGRTTELEALAEAVTQHRLVGITGPGGMGKTRLSLAAAALVSSHFEDGVWFVDLTPVSQPDAVDPAAVAALGEAPIPGMPARDVVVHSLVPRRALLIVDNCEHVPQGAADLVRAVLRSCPQVHVLATSRQALGVPGEWSFGLKPLSPEDQVELFLDRASAVGARSFLDSERVAELCFRLDGMPLAIELAAARLRSMSLMELRERLDERFRLLRGGRSDDPRHRTLRAVVDWSFAQLDATEQRFFCRLSVFAGDFTLDAANIVAGDGDELTTLDLLDALVERSLVVALEREAKTSYRLLETLRQYGREHLDQDDLATTSRRHAEHYATLVAASFQSLRAGEDTTALAGLARCWDNVREAVQIALQADDADLALRLVTPLGAYVNLIPDPEVAKWASAALERSGASRHPRAVWAHVLLSQVAYPQLKLDAAEHHARQAIAIIEENGLPASPRPYIALAYALNFQGHFSDALAAFRRAADLSREQGRTMELVEAIHNTVTCQVFAGNRWADEDLEELLEAAARAGNARALAVARWASGLTALVEGRADAATLLDEAATLAADRLKVVDGIFRGCARMARAEGSALGELAGLAEQLKIYDSSKVPFTLRGTLRSYTRALSALGRHRAVAIVEGAGNVVSIFPRDSKRAAEHARERLGSTEYDMLVEQGRCLTSDELADFIRSELGALAIRADPPLDAGSSEVYG